MTGQARVGDIGVGTCNQHESPKNVTVTMVSGGSVLTDGMPSCIMGSVGVGSCGHSAVAIMGAATCLIDGMPAFRQGDLGIVGGGSYTMVTGSPMSLKGDAAASVSGSPAQSSEFPGFTENVTAEEAAAQATEDQDTPLTDSQKALYQKAGVSVNGVNPDAPPADSTSAAPVQTGPVPTDCSDISLVTGTFSPAFRLSPNFTLGNVSTLCTLETHAVQAQEGLTVQQIVCNLRGVAANVLEPLLAQFGRPTINCGFRAATAAYGAPNSVHKLGQAVDLQWPNLTDEQYFQRACWIRDNLHWTQIILEYGGNRPWIHVSYDRNNPARSNLKTRVAVPNKYENGLILAVNVPKVGCRKIT